LLGGAEENHVIFQSQELIVARFQTGSLLNKGEAYSWRTAKYYVKM